MSLIEKAEAAFHEAAKQLKEEEPWTTYWLGSESVEFSVYESGCFAQILMKEESTGVMHGVTLSKTDLESEGWTARHSAMYVKSHLRQFAEALRWDAGVRTPF